MKRWLNEYGLYLRKTWLVSLAGLLVPVGLIAREFYALYVGISLYEQPTLPEAIWREVVYAVFVGTAIAMLLVTRVIILRRYGYSSMVFGLTFLTLLGFVAYGYLTPPASSNTICDGSGRCFGLYVLERQDWIDVAALLFFPGALMRSLVTAIVAAFDSRSRFE